MKTFLVSIRTASKYFDEHLPEQISIDDQEPILGQQIMYIHRSFVNDGIRRTHDPFTDGCLCRLSVACYGDPYCHKKDIAYWLPVIGPML